MTGNPLTKLKEALKDVTHHHHHEKKYETGDEVKVLESEPVVHETRREEEIVEKIPVIEREHHQTVVEQIIQPIISKEKIDAGFERKKLRPEEVSVVEPYRPGTLEKLERQEAEIKSMTRDGGKEIKVERYRPEVHESGKVHRHIIQQIHPVIEKEVLKTHVTQETIPVIERIYDPPDVKDLKINPPISEREFNRMHHAHAREE